MSCALSRPEITPNASDLKQIILKESYIVFFVKGKNIWHCCNEINWVQ
jgi:hypothetical protein